MLAFAMTMALPESYSTLQQTMWMQEHLDSSTVAGAVQAEWARRQTSQSTALYVKQGYNNNKRYNPLKIKEVLHISQLDKPQYCGLQLIKASIYG